MEILLTILGWLAWCFVAYLAITFVFGTRIYAKSGIPLNSITCVQTFLWWAITLTFLFSNLSKLHIFWLIPISFLGARFIVLTGFPPILAQVILLLTQIFVPLILFGVRGTETSEVDETCGQPDMEENQKPEQQADDARAHFNLAISYLNEGDIDSALKECHIVKELDEVLASELYDRIFSGERIK